MQDWSPKPLRPLYNLPIENEEVVVKHLSPIEKQRAEDGSQIRPVRPNDLKPADPALVIKGSMAEKLPNAPIVPKADPPVYDPEAIARIVKSYLNS